MEKGSTANRAVDRVVNAKHPNLGNIKTIISIVVMLVTIIIVAASGWGTLQARVDLVSERHNVLREDFEVQTSKIEAHNESTNGVLLEIQIQLAEIGRDLSYIRENMK